jgi:hypothetical protein
MAGKNLSHMQGVMSKEAAMRHDQDNLPGHHEKQNRSGEKGVLSWQRH